MKKYILSMLTFFLIILALTACSAPVKETTSSSVPPLTSTSLYSAPSPTPEPSPSFIPDTDIPYIVYSGEEPAANSNHELFEDDKYFYILIEDSPEEDGNIGSELYSVSKSDGSARQISKTYCPGFTLYNGTFYFAEDDKSGGAIISYDPKANKRRQIETFKNSVHEIVAYNGRLYFTYVTVYDKDAEVSVTDLYSIKLNGSDKKLIKKDVCTFCIYKDYIYFTSTEGVDGAELYKCGLDGRKTEQLLEWAAWYFEILNDRLFYHDQIYNEYYDEIYNEYDYDTKDLIGIIDLGTQKTTGIIEGYYDFVPLGQYIFYVEQEDEDSDSYFNAYNLDSGKTFSLIDLGPEYYKIYPGTGCVYISWQAGSCIHIAKVIIENGRASLKEAAVFQPEA